MNNAIIDIEYEMNEAVSASWMVIKPKLDSWKQLIVAAKRESLTLGKISDSLRDTVLKSFISMMYVLNDIQNSPSDLDEQGKCFIGRKIHDEILPYLLLTQNAERWYTKPRGYAGDYLMINGIYQNQPAGVGRVGTLIDQCFLNIPAAAAVRNRRNLLTKEILSLVNNNRAEKTLHITSLASGPATEVFDAFERLGGESSRCKITLVDIDYQSLAYVDDIATAHGVRKNLQLHHGNLAHLAMGKQEIHLQPQELIYSIGLIDYFDNQFVLALINYIYAQLADGGKVILGNFHPNNRGKAFMDHVLEWQLNHRTEQEMRQLFEQSKFGTADVQIQFEGEGINMFAGCVKG